MASIPIAMSEVSVSSSSSSAESELSARDDLIVLTNYVKALRESLARIKRIFNPIERIKNETIRVSAHERLADVLRNMRQILEKYPKIQSTELLMSARNLIQQVKNFNYDDKRADTKPFVEAVDQLAMAFNTRCRAFRSVEIKKTEQASKGSKSKAAETHKFRKLKTPSRCRECDSYVYFQGVECQECGLASHKKCLERLAIQCAHIKLPRRMNTFGVPLNTQTDNNELRHIVQKCIQEIDDRGSTIKGIYRVSGVKSRVEKLCQSFESGHELVDLSTTSPNVIANVLKLYLRQLPEPLLTFRLYPEFIHIAKSFPSSETHETSEEEEMEIVSELKQAVSRLPKKHYSTLAYLMHHLRRVSELSHENNMPPSNLGIVFGPTLLRTSNGDASLSSLIDTVHQSRLIELLVIYSTEVFGPDPSEVNNVLIENSPKQSKVFKSATCVTISGQKVVTSYNSNNNSKQSIVEARRQFFTSPASPPQYRYIAPTPTSLSSISPFSQSISSSISSHTKLRRNSSAKQPNTSNVNDLARSATHVYTFGRNNADLRQFKYV